MQTHFDLIAIGGGSGGLAVAERAAQLGRRIALVDPNPLGGTCVNAGCVPKKLMWYAANAAETVHDAAGLGIHASLDAVDWPALVSRRDALLADLNGYWAEHLASLGIVHVPGWARFVDARTVEVDGVRFSADHIVVATGSAPIVPPVPGAEHGITSDGFFALREQPGRVAIVGGGYIGVELAGVLHGLGSEVTLFALEPRLLPPFDPLIGETLGTTLAAEGVEMHLETAVTALEPSTDGITVVTANGMHLSGFDRVIWAVGRRPNTAGLDLERAGLETLRGGHIAADANGHTGVPGIHALGDVIEGPALTPVAIHQGRRLAELLFDPKRVRAAAHAHVPTVVFAHPPAGAVGLTEPEACARFAEVRVYETRFEPLGRALRSNRAPTAMKLVCAGSEEKVVGLHAIGDGVDEMLQGFAVALNLGVTKAELDRTVAIHPTSAEELVTLKQSRPGICASGLPRAA